MRPKLKTDSGSELCVKQNTADLKPSFTKYLIKFQKFLSRGFGTVMSECIFTYIVLCLIASMLVSCNLISGPKIKGTVKDKFTNKPIHDVEIIAKTQTNIEEDKKYEVIRAVSDSNGEFTLKGLSNKYSYQIRATKDSYYSTHEASCRVTPPENRKTRLLNKPLFLIKQSPSTGTITETLSGKPITGVKIVAESKRRLSINNQSFKRIEAQSDENGKYTIYLYPKINYNISFKKAGYSFSELSKMDIGTGQHIDSRLLRLPPNDEDYIITNNFEYKKIGNSIKSPPVIRFVQGGYNKNAYLRYFTKEQIAEIKDFKKGQALYYATIQPNVKKRNRHSSYHKTIAPLSFFNNLVTVYTTGGYYPKWLEKSSRINYVSK